MLSKWLHMIRRALRGEAAQTKGTRSRLMPFRPRVEALENRTLLSVAAHLVFAQQPTDTPAGSPISPVSVLLEDQFNNLVSRSGHNVSVATQINPSPGPVSGTTCFVASAGVATFTDLSIDQAGRSYTLAATALLPLGTGGATSIDRSDSTAAAPALGVTFQVAE